MLRDQLGVPRTYKLNKSIMAKMEKAVKKEMKQNTKKYSKDCPDFELSEWLQPNKLHWPHHPAHAFINEWSRERGHNYLALQIYEKLPDEHFIFDRALVGSPAA